jgi:transaldolase / glucose-6-phosphate isomerase
MANSHLCGFMLLLTITQDERTMAINWIQAHLSDQREAVEAALHRMADENIVQRIWQHDHTVWRPNPTEVTNRLGWLDAATTMRGEIGRLEAFRDQLMKDCYTDVLLLGMGGSSLAPEMFAKVFGSASQGLRLQVLDSTDPGAITHYAQTLDPAKTLFIVSSKSGSTVETHSFFKYFYNWTSGAVGKEHVAQHFVAITDPGSGLGKMARELKFREVFEADPNVGGRYSALTMFGLVPAALIGVNLDLLLTRAAGMADACRRESLADNPGAWLGTVMGALARQGRDKLTLIPSKSIEAFGGWAEQLIAESVGKEGKGILPVVTEPVGMPDEYGGDRVFVHLWKQGDFGEDAALTKLREAGHPIIQITLRDEYDLGGQFVMWEFATAVAGHILDVQPFDQPNVESAKIGARAMVDAYLQTGKLPQGSPAAPGPQVLPDFLAAAKPGDYVSVLAYITPTDDTTDLLHKLQTSLRARTKLATTAAYGPRYLHSTGQLHKGDAGRGHFIVLTADPTSDAPIPDEPGSDASAMSFRVLRDAQALGDKKTLEENGRKVLYVHLGSDALAGLRSLAGI